MGGYPVPLYSLNWLRILRPLGTVRSELSLAGAGGPWKTLAGLIGPPGDWLAAKLVAPLREPVSAYSAELVSAEDLLKCIQEVGWSAELRPLYTPETFPWLMREAAQNQWGTLRMMTVSNAGGELRGWFVYYATPGGASLVLQIGVRSKEDFSDTFAALLRDAWRQGSACVKGAAIPQYLTAMTKMHCIFRHPYDRVAMHSNNPAIVNAFRTGDAAMTRLDGIGWLRFSREKWES
jgi:hypothetical protein